MDTPVDSGHEPGALRRKAEGVLSLSRFEWALFLLVAVTLAVALAHRPLVRALDPDLAVSLAFAVGGAEYGPKVKRECGCLLVCYGEDPWGDQWHFVQTPPGWKATPANDRFLFGMHTGEKFWPYSAGPNGVPESGAGDDVFPTTWTAAHTATWRDLRGNLVTAAVWVVWMTITARCLRARRSRRASIECLRIAWISAGPVVVSVGVFPFSFQFVQDILAFADERAFAPLSFVFYGSIALPWVLGAAWLRLRRPPPDE